MYINILHLLWIVPLSAFLGILVIALANAASIRDDGIGEDDGKDC